VSRLPANRYSGSVGSLIRNLRITAPLDPLTLRLEVERHVLAPTAEHHRREGRPPAACDRHHRLDVGAVVAASRASR